VDSGVFRPVRFPSRYSDATGTVTYQDLLLDSYVVGADPPSPRYLRDEASGLAVREDATTTATLKLKLATALHVKILDVQNAPPARDFCVYYLTAGMHNVPQEGPCSHTGEYDLAGLVPGKYKVFIAPTDNIHGAQWVGPHGGVGDLDLAQAFDAKAGQTAQVNVILDRAGSIAGTIRDRTTHKPVPYHCGTVLPAPADHAVYGAGVGCANDLSGKYTITGLGPYAWKVEFPDVDSGYAWQWSGGAANRAKATSVQVHAGGTTTLNATLKPTGKITGTATAAGREPVDTEVVAVDTVTGDYAGFRGWPDETTIYTIQGLTDQKVTVIFRSQDWARPSFSMSWPVDVTTHAGQTVSGINLHRG
jgi:hypothetical protein